jgi:hypothetical protein
VSLPNGLAFFISPLVYRGRRMRRPYPVIAASVILAKARIQGHATGVIARETCTRKGSDF